MKDFNLYREKVLDVIETYEIKLQINFYLNIFEECLKRNDISMAININNIIKKKTGINYYNE